MSRRKVSALFAVVLASGLVAAGCGGDDDDGGEAETGTEVPISVPTDITVPTTSEQIDDAREQAYETCKDSLDDVPDEQRDQAEAACESLKPE